MLSKKTGIISGIIILVAVTVIVLSISSRRSYYSYNNIKRIGITVVAPIQKVVSAAVKVFKRFWVQYFSLVGVARENLELKKALEKIERKENFYRELELANSRFRNLLKFKRKRPYSVVAAEVVRAEIIGRDPSLWFKTVIIDKGKSDGVDIGFPVIVEAGVVGRIIETIDGYSKVLLIIDQNSAIDAFIQRNRAGGVVKGGHGVCILEYISLKEDVRKGDAVVSSGMDGVFPKGLPIGLVSEVENSKSELFLRIEITTYVDFEKLEEVLIVLKKPIPDFSR